MTISRTFITCLLATTPLWISSCASIGSSGGGTDAAPKAEKSENGDKKKEKKARELEDKQRDLKVAEIELKLAQTSTKHSLEDADEAVLAQAGLDPDEDTFAPIGRSVRRRAVWLGINLITAFIAAAVINMFEETIVKVVALAVLMPIVASMGGIAGTQTLTLVIRGEALGHIGRNNLLWLLNREFIVAVLNGLLWATLVAITAACAFKDPNLGWVIATAMIITIVIAALAGSLLPSVMRRLNIDPAIAGGVVLTTITDVTGFFVFLGLATWVYA